MIRLYCLLIGYICGCFQSAFFYGKIAGCDLRKHGSGNLGTTNTLRVLGSKAAILVLLLDVLKVGLAIFISYLLFGTDGNFYPLYAMYAGAGAVIGHDFPFYLKFKGGKGIAATLGLILFVCPYMVPLPLTVFIVMVAITHYVSLSSLTAYLVVFLQYLIVGLLGGITGNASGLNESYVILFILMALAYIQHIPNIKRLIKGCESKTYLKKKKDNEG